MADQRRDLRLYGAYVAWMRKNEWAIDSPLRIVERVLQPQHRLVSRQRFLTEVLDLRAIRPSRALADYERELIADVPLRQRYDRAINDGTIPRKFASFDDNVLRREANVVAYYALLRETAPSIVVETGTAVGWMTSWIVAALEANGHGRLISIDLPAVKGERTMQRTLSGDEIGALIPDAYRHRWTLLAGDAKVLVPRVLSENSVDVFCHDSLHTRTHMGFEYHAARCLMKPEALIVSDDIMMNSAFLDFVRTHHLPSVACVANPNIGITVNRFDQFELEIGTDVVAAV